MSRFFQRFGVPIWTALVLGYLLLPIAVMVLFSFNDPPGRFNFIWGEPSLAAWQNPLGAPNLDDAVMLSLAIGVVAGCFVGLLDLWIARDHTPWDWQRRLPDRRGGHVRARHLVLHAVAVRVRVHAEALGGLDAVVVIERGVCEFAQ